MKRYLASILAADAVGYSRLIAAYSYPYYRMGAI